MTPMQTEAIKELGRRAETLAQLQKAFQSADRQDWEYLFSIIPDGGVKD